ncbi:MAG: type I-G CRISPR-associated protein Csb2 [Pseudonocardiaceae bacterium]
MSFAIIAELPLGVYYGGVGDGEVDPLPSPARLHAALLCAAAQGPRARPDGELLAPRDEDAAALRWLERHPPDGIHVPIHTINTSAAIAYRKLGLLEKHKERIIGRTVMSVAVAGPYAWTWASEPGAAVRAALSELCCEVSHLGQAQTPVRLSVGDIEPSHHLDPDADLFSGTGVEVDVSVEGRTDALAEDYARAHATAPTVSADGVRGKEDERRRPVVRAGLAPARYVAPAPAPTADPWTRVLLLPLRSHWPRDWERLRVRWAVALHRALISLIGDGAPTVLTGAYATGVQQPANRVAIQPIDGSLRIPEWNEDRAGFAILLPRDADAADLRVLASAVRALRLVKGPRGGTVTIDHRNITVRSATEFWQPPAAGRRRHWVTTPAAVPETRGLRRGSWSLTDAVRLSIGLVWRDELTGHGRGEAWYRQIADAAAGRGVQVQAVRRVTDTDLGRFVHKVAAGSVVQPYRADVTLGGLAGDRALVAIGQSRHLGGGLLVPCDQPDHGSAS